MSSRPPRKQGERLSHAVGCAFAACLERKQRREKECGLTAAFDTSRPPVTREGSFRAPDKKQGEHPRGVGGLKVVLGCWDGCNNP